MCRAFCWAANGRLAPPLSFSGRCSCVPECACVWFCVAPRVPETPAAAFATPGCSSVAPILWCAGKDSLLRLTIRSLNFFQEVPKKMRHQEPIERILWCANICICVSPSVRGCRWQLDHWRSSHHQRQQKKSLDNFSRLNLGVCASSWDNLFLIKHGCSLYWIIF